MQKYKILIDTDPGVDDAMAILMAHDRADVLGLSVAAGNVGLNYTVANALKLVDVIGAQTPVYAGCATPLVHAAADAAAVHGSDGFGDTGYTPSTRKAQSEHAALAILRASHEHAGKLVLVALAPLTNVALALKLDPSLPQRVAKFVVMGGAVTGRGNYGTVPAEFNIGFDPEAAHVVFSSWPHFTLVDWEATVRHGLDFERFEAMLDKGDARAQFYASITQKTRAWSRERGRPKLLIADALAMAVALEPDIVLREEERHVAVELDGRLTRGATVVDWENRLGERANARIVLDVDQSRFEALLASAVGAR
ncbi:MAG: nucleoside hydrolase [Rudaea sp.]|uniref:nucleoside hydrolase n=1 Tax=unclassified Rudaea TaxID=2627037 RepID=UPI0010F71732|nr:MULTISPECIES: nucleoside hydrolase [unclassified Rudaea]MBN8887206.1 nucleoside hydrolase [Rudaea sp.]